MNRRSIVLFFLAVVAILAFLVWAFLNPALGDQLERFTTVPIENSDPGLLPVLLIVVPTMGVLALVGLALSGAVRLKLWMKARLKRGP